MGICKRPKPQIRIYIKVLIIGINQAVTNYVKKNLPKSLGKI